MNNSSQLKKLLTGGIVLAAMGAGTILAPKSADAAALIGDVALFGGLNFNANSFDFTTPIGSSSPSPNIAGDVIFTSVAGLTAGPGKIKDLCNDAVVACGDGLTGSPIFATPLPLTEFLTFDDLVNGGTGSFTLESISGPNFDDATGGIDVGFGVTGKFLSSFGDVSNGSGLFTTQLALGSAQLVSNGITDAASLESFLGANPTEFLFSTESASLTLSAVPEPGSIFGSALFAAFGAGAVLKKRRSNKQAKTA